MSIEKTIEEILSHSKWDRSQTYYDSVDDKVLCRVVDVASPKTWPWPGRPFTVRFNNGSRLGQKFKAIDYQIEQATAAECLTSEVPYIRECKKWMIEEDKKR